MMSPDRPFAVSPTAGRARPALMPLAVLGVLLAVELAAISLAYTHDFQFNCRAAAPDALCAALSLGVMRAIALIGAGGMILLARPAVLRRLRDGLHPRLAPAALVAQVAGVALILAPWTFLGNGVSTPVLAAGIGLWLAGLALAAAGTALALAPARTWGAALREAGLPGAAVLALAAVSPELTFLAQGLWSHVALISSVTFEAVAALLRALGYPVVLDPSVKLVSIEGFNVLVGPQCSGVEGFALISAFLLLYIWLFREHLRFPRVWLLLPLGILLSWCFNVVRIAALVLIGHHVSPELAVQGFHSHAGWLMFTILSVSLAALAWRVPAFRSDLAAPAATTRAATARPAPVPFFSDPVVAMILPFIVFMGTALLFSTFTHVPAAHYPWRAAAMAAVLALFLPYLLKLEWKADPVAIGMGLVIGAAWVLTAPRGTDEASDLATALAAMSGPALAVWVIARLIGTSLLVPVIEELFFRGYVLRQIDTGGLPMRLLALAVSTGLFAAFHDRWLAAGLAGLVFGLLMLRSGRVTDAIIAHAVANALIAGVALAEGDFSLI